MMKNISFFTVYIDLTDHKPSHPLERVWLQLVKRIRKRKHTHVRCETNHSPPAIDEVKLFPPLPPYISMVLFLVEYQGQMYPLPYRYATVQC